VIRPSAIDPLDQWIEFSKAKIIIAPHGAALSNLLAAQENAFVVELMPESYQASTFNFISAALSLRYHRICYDDSTPEIPIISTLDSLKRLLAA
jgi:capsular polysaccharide biosynthesis protein